MHGRDGLLAGASRALASMGRDDRQYLLDEENRRELSETIAKMRHTFATQCHRLPNGERIDLERYPFQPPMYEDTSTNLTIMGSVQWGKRQQKSNKVHTPQGWRQLGDLKVGDRVSVPDGGDAAVTGIFPQGVCPVYRVTTADGRQTTAGDEHLWEVQFARRDAGGVWRYRPHKPIVVTTDEIRRRLDRGERAYIPLPVAPENPKRDLPLDPYLLGYLIGNGSMSQGSVTITVPDEETVERLRGLLPADARLAGPGKRGIDYRIAIEGDVNSWVDREPTKEALTALGLYGHLAYTKFIPREYMEAPAADRLALFQGLMDSDGYSSLSLHYSTSSPQLAKDVRELAWSLGAIATIADKPEPTYTYQGEKKVGQPSWKVHIRHKYPRSLFRLERKRMATVEENRRFKNLRAEITSIEPTGEADCVCIAVDHPRHLYITDDYICTHNTVWMVCDALASAACGLSVLFVISKADKRNKFVANYVKPLIRLTPAYAKFADESWAGTAGAESTQLMHFGQGSVNWVSSNTPKDFSTHACDKASIDEHQECNFDNISMVDDRMSGSKARLRVTVGNPRHLGTAENQNLHWIFLQSDQRRWHVTCHDCGHEQILDWESHVVEVRRNRGGGIAGFELRDRDWTPSLRRDIKPICTKCRRPVDRLSRHSRWIPTSPLNGPRGYQLSNLCNPNKPVREMVEMYSAAMRSPIKLQQFVNNQLGLPFTSSGSRITEEMLAACAAGMAIPTYELLPMSRVDWRKL